MAFGIPSSFSLSQVTIHLFWEQSNTPILNNQLRVSLQFKVKSSDIRIISMAGEIKHNILGRKTGCLDFQSLSPNCCQKTSMVEASPQTHNMATTFSYLPFPNS